MYRPMSRQSYNRTMKVGLMFLSLASLTILASCSSTGTRAQPLGANPPTTTADSKQDRRLSVSLVNVHLPRITIRVANNTDKDVNVYEPGHSWGDGQFTIGLSKGSSDSTDIDLKGVAYTMNIPAPHLIRAHRHADFRWDLSSEWLSSPEAKRWREPWRWIRVSMHIEADADARKSHVITGQWQSDWISLK